MITEMPKLNLIALSKFKRNEKTESEKENLGTKFVVNIL